MKISKPKSIHLIRFLPLLVFFVFSVVYLFGFTSYLFYYQEKSTLFLTSFSHFVEHLNQPGGFLVYLGELQNAFYFYPLIGAILVSVEICLIMFLIHKIIEELNGRSLMVIPILTGAALFYLQTHYQYSSLNNLGVLIQVLTFYLIIRFLKGGKLWIAVLLFPLQYFLFGSFSLLLLVLVSIFILSLDKQNSWLKLAVLISLSLSFFYLGKEYLFFQTNIKLLFYPYSSQTIGLQVNLFFMLIGFISLLPLLGFMNIAQLDTYSGKKVLLIKLLPYVLILALIVISVPRIDKKNSHYFHVEKLFFEHRYEEIIEYNREFPSANILSNFLNNIALSETGKLTDLFFSFPQSADGGTLFLKWEIVSEVLKRGGYFYYNLGMINEAQRWAYEYLVMRGNSPEALKLLIKTELINGNYKMAEKYIAILKQSIFYISEANEFGELLFNVKAINKHPELGVKKSLKTKQDFFVISDQPYANLDLILKADSSNRVAMEYKLAGLLIQKDMKGIVAELPRLEKMGYSSIPKNVEEAVVTYKMLKLGKMPKLNHLKIKPETVKRFQAYYQIYQQNSGNKLVAQKALVPKFGDTYWYYVFFK